MAEERKEEKKRGIPTGVLVGLGAGAAATIGTGLYLLMRRPGEEEPPPEGKANLSGSVTDSQTGQPIEGALVTLDSMGGPGYFEAFTDDYGNYSFQDVTPGDYRLEVEKEGYQRQSYSLTLYKGDQELNIALIPEGVPAAEFHCGVWDSETGEAIVSALVELTGPQSRSILTNEFGDASFYDLPVGTYTIRITKANYEPIEQLIDIPEGRTEMEFNLTYIPSSQGIEVRWLTVDPDEPIAGQPILIRVQVVNISGVDGDFPIIMQVNGEMLTQTVHLTAEGSGCSEVVIFHHVINEPGTYVVACEQESVTITVLPYTSQVTGRVLDSETHHGVRSVKVALDGPQSYETYTDENGEFIFYDVEAGSYQITFTKSAYEPVSFWVDIQAGLNALSVQYLTYVPPTDPQFLSFEVTKPPCYEGFLNGQLSCFLPPQDSYQFPEDWPWSGCDCLVVALMIPSEHVPPRCDGNPAPDAYLLSRYYPAGINDPCETPSGWGEPPYVIHPLGSPDNIYTFDVEARLLYTDCYAPNWPSGSYFRVLPPGTYPIYFIAGLGKASRRETPRIRHEITREYAGEIQVSDYTTSNFQYQIQCWSYMRYQGSPAARRWTKSKVLVTNMGATEETHTFHVLWYRLGSSLGSHWNRESAWIAVSHTVTLQPGQSAEFEDLGTRHYSGYHFCCFVLDDGCVKSEEACTNAPEPPPEGESNFAYDVVSCWEYTDGFKIVKFRCTITNQGSEPEEHTVSIWMYRKDQGIDSRYLEDRFTLTLNPGESYDYAYPTLHVVQYGYTWCLYASDEAGNESSQCCVLVAE